VRLPHREGGKGQAKRYHYGEATCREDVATGSALSPVESRCPRQAILDLNAPGFVYEIHGARQFRIEASCLELGRSIAPTVDSWFIQVKPSPGW